jgi:hypothetical protein
MLKKIECALMMVMDLVAPCMLMLFVLAGYDAFISDETIKGFTCVAGSMIPTAVIYTRHMREDECIEEYEEENEE